MTRGLAAAESGSSTSGKGIEIRFKGEPGKSFEAKYFSTSRILTYSDRQLVKDRTESVEFTTKTDIKAFDGEKQTIEFTNTTIHKDGVVPLHDLAFPEKGEALDYLIKTTGEVLRVGDLPPQSIFYVPSMPTPVGRVEVGDTWPMEHLWASSRDGIPLRLQVVAILKSLTTCNGHKCADVEISGSVKLAVAPDRTAKFESRVWGRMLFDLERGDVTWSQTRSREEMMNLADRVVVNSCMVSETKGDKGYKTKLECEPKEEPVSSVPSL